MTLRGWLMAERRSWREILAVFEKAGAGLAAAHGAGVVHRDFKPDNVLIGNQGRVVVTDFGLARHVASSAAAVVVGAEAEVDVAIPSNPSAFTKTGAVLGTPAYMAPEQRIGEQATPLSDQYSFCVSLFEAIYGVRPSRSERNASRVPPNEDATVPAGVREALARGLQLDPSARHESMKALFFALNRAGSSRSSRARLKPSARASLAVVAAGGVVLFGARSLDAKHREFANSTPPVRAELASMSAPLPPAEPVRALPLSHAVAVVAEPESTRRLPAEPAAKDRKPVTTTARSASVKSNDDL